MTEISEARIAEIRRNVTQFRTNNPATGTLPDPVSDCFDLLAALAAAEAERDRMRDTVISAYSDLRETIRDMTRDNESLHERALDAEEKLDRAKSDLEIAVEALKKLRRRGDSLETFDSAVDEIVKRALAFIAQN
jgi:hypothetical protein